MPKRQVGWEITVYLTSDVPAEEWHAHAQQIFDHVMEAAADDFHDPGGERVFDVAAVAGPSYLEEEEISQ